MPLIHDFPRVEFYRDAAGEFRWRLRSRNGKILCDGAEGYTSRGGCKEGFLTTVKYLTERTVEEVYEDSWRT